MTRDVCSTIGNKFEVSSREKKKWDEKTEKGFRRLIFTFGATYAKLMIHGNRRFS